MKHLYCVPRTVKSNFQFCLQKLNCSDNYFNGIFWDTLVVVVIRRWLKYFGLMMRRLCPSVSVAAGSAAGGVERTQPVISAGDRSRAGGEQHH